MRRIFAILMVMACTMLHAQEKVTLLFGGDAMVHSPQFQWALDPETKTYDFTPCFRYIHPYVEAADLAVVNLEVTLGGEPYSGYPNFSAPDAYLDALLGAGFDVMTLANNHILDRGKRGLHRTLDQLGTTPNTGAYRDSTDRLQRYPLMLNVKGLQVALFNCTYGCNGYFPIAPNMVNFIDTAEIARDLASLEGKAVDLKVIYIHWGIEYELQAVAKQREMAEWLAKKGFDLIIGGHPHVVEDATVLHVTTFDGEEKDVPVFYSLGNLISNQRRENTNGGILVRVELSTKPLAITHVEYLPCYVHKGLIKTAQGGEKITEKQYFLIPTPQYLNGKMNFKLSSEEEGLLKRFDQLTRKRLDNIEIMH